MQTISSAVRTNWCEEGKDPAGIIQSGEIFVVESTSFTEGHTPDTIPQLKLDLAVAPLTAPILVKGARPGNVLRIDILELRFTRDFGCIFLIPGRGAFPSVTDTLIAQAVPITDYEVRLSDSLVLPTHKMIGKVSVAPPRGRVLSSLPGRHGGNMDNRDICVGSSVYLPVFVDEAHLGIGDAHAVQGDGECGISAVEVEMSTVARVTLISNLELQTPVVKSGGYVMTMGAGESLDEAAREALHEMKRLLQQHRRLNEREAVMLMSLACDVHVSQLVNPLVGVKARIPQHLLQLP